MVQNKETPMETDDSENVSVKGEVFERESADYQDLSSRYLGNSENYSKQFAKIYTARISELSKVLIEKTRKKWGKKNFK